jgi:UDP-N-acetylglucosamine 1-carboxyvinyltransferase
MDKFVIQGGRRLAGEIAVGGSKNAALPILAAVLAVDGPVVLRAAPNLADVRAMCDLLGELGCRTARDGDGTMTVEVRDESHSHAVYDRVRKMRASICVLGPLLAKRGYARVSMPGGCAIGPRPIDLHLRGLRALGAEIEQHIKGLKRLGAEVLIENGYVHARCTELTGNDVFMGGRFGSTVLGTANVMTAAALAEGETMIESAACEPEIQDLADFLNACGAKVAGAGTPRVTIEGVRELRGVEHTVIPDRIEAGTFMMAAAITNGELTLKNARIDHLLAVVDKLREIGVTVEPDGEGAKVHSARRLAPADVTTQPYPGFPTDLQAQLMALLCLADGNSAITEKIFPDRFLHVAELLRMGANLRKEGPTAIVTGAGELVGAPVMASDLRASAALVLAALAARGTSEIRRVYHIERGYEHIETKLHAVGAAIRRIAE